MKQFIGFAIFIISSLCVLNTDAASYCYACTNCADPFDNVQNTSCPVGSDTCMKTFISFPSSVSSLTSGGGSKLIFRGCVPAAACSTPFGFSVLGYGFSIGCCSGNLCNSAQSKSITVTTSILPILAAIYYLRK